jgi:hypothetical protein
MVQVQDSHLDSAWNQAGGRVGTGTKDKCRFALTMGGCKGNGKGVYKAG